LAGWAGPWLRHVGGPVLTAVAGLIVVTGLWWFTMRILLAGRGLLAEAVPVRRRHGCVLGGHGGGLLFFFSGIVITDNRKSGRSGLSSPSWPSCSSWGWCHPRRGGGPCTAYTRPILQSCLQEIAAEPVTDTTDPQPGTQREARSRYPP